MSTLPQAPFQSLQTFCMEALARGEARSPLPLAEGMMEQPGVAMHCPEHHFIVPAALITSVRLSQGAQPEVLIHDLKLIGERAAKVPGGFCGFHGCCGAAVGCGIFAAVLLDVSPKKESSWGAINRFTAACLNKVASVDGPRCCKRVTYLALQGAAEHAPALLGIQLEPPGEVVCTRFAQNKECKGVTCPFFPR